MKRFWDDTAAIRKTLHGNDILILLDFDGTLSSIVRHPADARMNVRIRKTLLRLKELPQVHIGIISGRSLTDIRNRIGIRGLFYSGNHGREWEIYGQRYEAAGAGEKFRAIRRVRRHLERLETVFDGVVVEDKSLTVSIHYRMLARDRRDAFLKEIGRILKRPVADSLLSVRKGKRVLDVTPLDDWNKYRGLKQLLASYYTHARRETAVIYVGDDTTDEDVFERLTDAVTVRVGRKRSSRAAYYVTAVSGVNRLLEWLLNNALSE